MAVSERPGRRPVVLWCSSYEAPVRALFEKSRFDVKVVSPAVALELAQTETVDAIVSEWSDHWRKILSKISHPVAFVHLGSLLPQALVEFVVTGGKGWSAKTPTDAFRRVAQWLAPQRASPRLPFGDATRVFLEGQSLEGRLLDCSSSGLAFWVPATTPIDRFAEGSVLSQLTLEHDGKPVLQDITVQVRSLVASNDGFRVGCQFQRELIPAFLGDRAFEDQLHTLATISRIAKVASILVQSETGQRFELPPGAHVDAATRRLGFSQPIALEPFDVVRCSAYLDDSRFEWLSAVVSKDPFTLQLPLRVDESVRRHPIRRTPPARSGFHFTHPLSQNRHSAKVIDFSPDGAQIALDETPESFPPGLRLLDVTLSLGGIEVHPRAEVRHHEGDRVGLQLTFEAVPEANHLRLAWVAAGNKGVTDGSQLGFDAIWQLCREAGLVNPEIASTFEPLIPQARITQTQLAEGAGLIFNALACTEGDTLVGYLSAFRAYQHTWYVQHMAAVAAGTKAAATLNRAIGELCEQTGDARYFQLAYYVDNPWPARVFGGFARRVDSSGAALRIRDFQRIKNDSAFAQSPTPRCRVATAADTSGIVSLLASHEPALLLHAMDLDADRLSLRGTHSLYQRHHLDRTRVVYLCEAEGQLLGVALCEAASVGINFRELASVSRVYVAPNAPAWVATELSAASCAAYRALGRPFTMICGSAAIPSDALWGAPFQLAELTARKELLRDFKRLARLSSAMVSGRRFRPPRSKE